MPGICGLITRMPREQAERQVAAMLRGSAQEPFYSSGTWSDTQLGVYVGWTAIRDSFADGMPLTSESGRTSLIFSGEEFPASDAGMAVGSNPRSSYLLGRYDEDPNFPAGLNGLFHGLLADHARGKAVLFNDRFNMHRLYYYETSDAVYFAAEAKSILAVCPETRQPDEQGLGEFVAYNCVLDNRTIFKGVRVIPPASAWTICEGKVTEKHLYFTPDQWENQEPLGPEEYYSELHSVLVRNLPRYFAGPESIGMTVTGGMDTRVILSLSGTSRPPSLSCYTFGGMYRECEDVRIARKVANACHLPHQVIPVGDDFLSRFADYAERTAYLTEGGINLYFSADLYASEKAREIAPAKIVGTYGSEILREAVMFKPIAPTEGLFSQSFVPHIQNASETYAAARRSHPVTFAAFRQSPWYHYGVLALEQSQLTVRSPFLDNDFVKTVYRAPQSLRTAGDVRLRLIRDGNTTLARLRSDRGIGGDSIPLYSSLLRGYLEFTFKAEYAYDYGMPQWVASIDGALSQLHLERLFLGRHKFSHFRLWYRDQLSGYVREMLLNSRALSRPYVDRKKLEDVVQSHTTGRRNYTSEIHKLLTLELLHQLFFDPQPARLSSVGVPSRTSEVV